MGKSEITPEMLNSLPRSVRRQLQKKTQKLMADLGVQPMIDQRTGETVYDLGACAKALGLSGEDARAALSDDDVRSVSRANLKPVQ